MCSHFLNFLFCCSWLEDFWRAIPVIKSECHFSNVARHGAINTRLQLMWSGMGCTDRDRLLVARTGHPIRSGLIEIVRMAIRMSRKDWKLLCSFVVYFCEHWLILSLLQRFTFSFSFLYIQLSALHHILQRFLLSLPSYALLTHWCFPYFTSPWYDRWLLVVRYLSSVMLRMSTLDCTVIKGRAFRVGPWTCSLFPYVRAWWRKIDLRRCWFLCWFQFWW